MGAGVQRTTPKLPKGSLLVTKWTKMGFYEGVSPKKVHFLSQSVLKMEFYEV